MSTLTGAERFIPLCSDIVNQENYSFNISNIILNVFKYMITNPASVGMETDQLRIEVHRIINFAIQQNFHNNRDLLSYI